MEFASTSPQAPAPAHERRAIGRVAAGIWAAIAFFGALATLKPLRFPEMDVSAMRVVVISSTVIAVAMLAVPWARMPRAFVNLMLVLMAGSITALVEASGAVANDLLLIAVFAIALAVCFLPVRTSVAQLVLIALLVAAGLVMLGRDDAGIQAPRTTLLLSVLVVLCGLVLILRATIAEREAAVGHRIFDDGVLDDRGFEKTLHREVSRATRHERPLSLVLLEVCFGGERAGADALRKGRAVPCVGHAILERVRVEDYAGHLGGLRFAVLAPETPATGAASIAETVSRVTEQELESLGYERSAYEIATGWADYPHHADTAGDLLAAAQHNLEASRVRNELRPSAPQAEGVRSGRPATAGPHPG